MRGKFQRRYRFDPFHLFVALAILAIVLIAVGSVLKGMAAI